MVKEWKNALWQGGDMIGIQLGQGQDEGTFVQEVIEKVSKMLDRVPLEVAKHPVGIDCNLKAIRPLLHINTDENNVYMVGIVGEGGIGKTTISKAICNDIFNRFDDWCFLPNVRETSRVVNGLALLQKTLLDKLLTTDLKVWSVDEGKQLIKKRLCNKRVLVILDDLDELAQFDALAGNLDWFGKGSRIIVTTRNSHLLPSDRVKHKYRMRLLEKSEADSLFRLHAFGERQEYINIDTDLIERFVDYAKELPLALVVLGAFLRDRSPFLWKLKLQELADSPDSSINSVLRISFDGLEDKYKEIFLDVACFFKGWDKHEVEKILDGCGFATSLGIAILVERCLVTVDDGKIQMHDLIEVMGQNVVRADYLKSIGLPSRIWLYEDFLEVLSKNMAQEKHGVTGIVLNSAEKKDGLVKANALMDFKNLRIFIVLNGDGPEEPLRVPGELRWLEWQGYSASSIEFDQSSNKIVNLDLAKSRITKIKGKGFKELKYLNVGEGMSLTTIDGLLAGNCNSLNILTASKVEHKFIQKLMLSGNALKELPDEELPQSIGNLITLKILNISDCEHLSIIPHSIYKFRALKDLRFQNCPKLERFPRMLGGSASDVFGLPNLATLILSGCRFKDVEFLEDLTCFQTLYDLNLSGNEFARVPWCLRKFKYLVELDLSDCRSLIEVPELPSNSIRYLRADGSGLGRNFLVESLPLEKVRGFTQEVKVVCGANELPQWVNFQTTECGSRFQVSLPRSMSNDNILGLAVFVIVERGCIPFDEWCQAYFEVGDENFLIHMGKSVEVQTCFMYIPREEFQLDQIRDWRSINFKLVTRNNVEFHSLGLRMLCKIEEDEQRIRFRKIESNERDSSESQYESDYECLSESGYESALSEW